MTTESAIEILIESKHQNEIMRDNPNNFFSVSDIVSGEKNARKRIDALDIAIRALREQQERENTKPPSDFLAPMDSYKGLKRKYIVFKSDTGEMVENCFVLRPDKDHAAVAALRAYAGVTENETLSADIINWVGDDRNDPLTLDELKEMDGEPVWMQPNSPPKCGKWAIVVGVDTEYGEKTLYLEGDFTCRDYGKTWLAYRHKPKEGQE